MESSLSYPLSFIFLTLLARGGFVTLDPSFSLALTVGSIN